MLPEFVQISTVQKFTHEKASDLFFLYQHTALHGRAFVFFPVTKKRGEKKSIKLFNYLKKIKKK